MGYHRQAQRAPLNRAELEHLLGDLLLAENAPLTRADPFGIDDPCPFNPAGHQFIGSCGDVACVHCAKVVWS